MATLAEVLATLTAMGGYVHHEFRVAEPHFDKFPEGTLDTRVYIYTFWMNRDPDNNNIESFRVDILVKNETDDPGEEARVYRTSHMERLSHEFRDKLLTAIDGLLGDVIEKVVIVALAEDDKWAIAKYYEYDDDPGVQKSTEKWAVAFYKKGVTDITFRKLTDPPAIT